MMKMLSHLFLVSLLALLANCLQPNFVWRADGRDYAKIKSLGGFQCKANTNHLKADYSLYNHIKVDGGPTADDDGYVSTSSDRDICVKWIRDHHKGQGTIYKISAASWFLDVPATLLQYDKYKEKEWACRGDIPWSRIVGWTVYKDNKPILRDSNHDFDKTTEKEYGGGPMYRDAGFPPGHIAWTKSPWMHYAPVPQPSQWLWDDYYQNFYQIVNGKRVYKKTSGKLKSNGYWTWDNHYQSWYHKENGKTIWHYHG